MAVVQKRKIQWAISLLLVMLYFYGMPAQAQYGGGSGTAEDQYLIFTAEQMNAIGANSNDWGKHFKLMADIDLSELRWQGWQAFIQHYCPGYRQHQLAVSGNSVHRRL